MKHIAIILISFLLCSTLLADSRIVILDVGEGQAVLLKHDTEGILIDTGHPGMALRVLSRLKTHGVERLAFLILTHLHPDHAGGYFRLREAFPDAMILHPAHPLPADVAPDLVRWVNDALKLDPRQKRILGGDHLNWHDFRLEILWPFQFTSANLNRHSLVIRVRYADTEALLMGDADRVVEQSLLKSGMINPVRILVAGHHGAGDTGDLDFLNRLSPDFAVISVNADNIRGYPASKTISALSRTSRILLRTDKDGEICFQLDTQPDHPLPHCYQIRSPSQ